MLVQFVVSNTLFSWWPWNKNLKTLQQCLCCWPTIWRHLQSKKTTHPRWQILLLAMIWQILSCLGTDNAITVNSKWNQEHPVFSQKNYKKFSLEIMIIMWQDVSTGVKTATMRVWDKITVFVCRKYSQTLITTLLRIKWWSQWQASLIGVKANFIIRSWQ